MSSIDFLTKTVIWNDKNYIGLNDAWVEDLIADGYTLIDHRTKQSHTPEGLKKILKWLNLKI